MTLEALIALAYRLTGAVFFVLASLWLINHW